MIDQDFDRANEKAWLVGAAYDFSKVLTQGLSANFNFAWGIDAINPVTRRMRRTRPSTTSRSTTVRRGSRPRPLRGLWFRARAAVLDQQDAKVTGYQFRVIINWERDLF